jgi:hypothetical protein
MPGRGLSITRSQKAAVIATGAAIKLNRHPGAMKCGTEVIEPKKTRDYRKWTDALDLTDAPPSHVKRRKRRIHKDYFQMWNRK